MNGTIPATGVGDFAGAISVKRETPAGGHVHLGVGKLTVGGAEESAVAIEIAHPDAPNGGIVTCFALRLPTFAVLLDCMMECFSLAQGIEARSDEIGTGSVHDGPTPKGVRP